MYKIIKLECRKFKFHFISKGTIIAMLSILAFVLMTAFIGKTENDPMCNSIEEWLVSINLFSMMTFIIYGGTVLSKIIISEYRTKTIQLMFMYPIDRKKLLLAKTIIVYLFTTINMIIANIFVVIGAAVADRIVDFVPGEFNFASIIPILPLFLISILSSGFLAIVPLYFGMRKKSTSHTIVAAIIVTLLTCSGGNLDMAGFLTKIMIAGGVALISFLLTIGYTLNNIDHVAIE